MNAITLLKDDHRRVKALFKQYEKLGPRAGASKAKLVKEITRELVVHSSIEETVFYPNSRTRAPKTLSDVLESLEEHHIIEWTLDELSKMKPSDERYDAKMTVLMESVRHHIKDEEEKLFPQVARALPRTDLLELGEELEAARKIAIKRPHPKAPDTPPANILAAAAALPIDAAKEKVEELVHGGG